MGPKAWVAGVRAKLSLVTGTQHHQPRLVEGEHVERQPESGHGAWREVLDDHVGCGDQPAGQLHAARRFQVEVRLRLPSLKKLKIPARSGPGMLSLNGG